MLFNVPQNELIEKTAEELKKLIHMPSWAPFVKTGAHKQRPPVKDDWWYVRAAAVLRTIYLQGPMGVSKLRVKYGGKKNRGYKPEKFAKGSGSVIRKVLQQLEESKLIKQAKVGKHKGRIITPKGASILYSVAKKMGGSIPKKAAKPTATTETKASEKPKAEAKPEQKADEIKEAEPAVTEEKPAKEEKAEKPKEVIPKEEQLMKAPKEIKKNKKD